MISISLFLAAYEKIAEALTVIAKRTAYPQDTPSITPPVTAPMYPHWFFPDQDKTWRYNVPMCEVDAAVQKKRRLVSRGEE